MSDTLISRSACEQRDREDALAPLREAFDLPDGIIYLDGNSLGARPRAALARAQQVIAEEWGVDLIRSWNKAGWFDMPKRLGDQLAPLIGANAGETVVTDSTSVNLFKALAAALDMQARRAANALANAETTSNKAGATAGEAVAMPARTVIVTERGNFPTDIYMAEAIAQWLQRGYRVKLIDAVDELDGALGQDTAVLMLTHVNYRTGYQHDMQAVTALAHARGALMVWDLAHSAGAVPVDLNGCQADLAVGCTYKYLNGGPGAPAFIWVAARHHAGFRQPLAGWWGHATPFAMQPGFVAGSGITRALCGTQAIVSLALVECGLDIFARTDMAAVRIKSLALTELFIALVEQRCGAHPLTLETPRDGARRGSQVSFSHPHGYAVMQALISCGVIGDYREPGILRFGFTPLYTRYVDVWDAAEQLAAILDGGLYDLDAARDAVT